MASTAVQSDVTTERIVRYYSRSLWSDPFFATAFALLVINLAMVASVFYDYTNYLGFLNSFDLFLAPAFLLLIAFISLRTHAAIRDALGPSGSAALREMSMSPLQRTVLQAGIQVPRFAFFFAVTAFGTLLHVLFKVLEHR